MIKFTNTDEFERKLRSFAKKAEIDVGVVAKRMAFSAFKSIVIKTPVDTGRARSSWNISEGSIDQSVSPEVDKTESRGRGSGKFQQATAISAKKLRQLRHVNSRFPVFYITNSLPYIIPLEEGHSSQADKGYMVKRTLVELNEVLDGMLEGIDNEL